MARSIVMATLADADRIAELAREVDLGAWRTGDYRAETLREDTIFLCARDSELQTVGFIVGRIVPDSNGPGCVAEVYNVGVAGKDRRSGIGSDLLREFLIRCRKARVQSVWLDVREGNGPARAFYERHGFEQAGTRAKFYTEPDEDAVLMRLSL